MSEAQTSPATWRERLLPAVPGLVLALVLALWGLDQRSLWLDEALSVGAVNQPVETVRATGGTMVGYYAVLTGWTTVSDSIWWLRLLSVLVMVASLVPLCAVARRLGGERLAIRAGLFAAGAYAFTRFAQEARAYALVTLLVTLSWWWVTRAVLDEDAAGSRRLLFRLAVTFPLATLCHGMAGLHLVAIAAALALAPDRRAHLRALVPAVVTTAVTVVALFVAGIGMVGDWIPPLNVDQFRNLLLIYTSPDRRAGMALVLLLGFALVRAQRRAAERTLDARERWLVVLPWVWTLVPVLALTAISTVRPYLVDRYLIGIVPGLALLLARATADLDDLLSRWRGRTVPAVTLVALLVLLPGQHLLHADRSDDWRGAARQVATAAEPGDALLLVRADLRPPLEAAWREVPPGPLPRLIQFERPLGEVRRLDTVADDEAQAAALGEATRVWVIDRTNSTADPLALVHTVERLRQEHGFTWIARHVATEDFSVVLLVRA